MAGGTFTNSGAKLVLDRTFTSSPTYTTVSEFKVGIGTTAVSVTDTDLEDAVPIAGTESVDDCSTADFTDSADMTTSLNYTIFKEGTTGLDLVKDAGTVILAETHKTTTSLDFTGKEFNMWVYVSGAVMYSNFQASGAIVIRFGSDLSNWYYWEKAKTDLAVGWNRIDGLNSGNATGTSGAPVIGACDYTEIRVNASGAGLTWTSGALVMDDLKLVSSSDYTTTFESGYPTIDYTTKTATVRTRLSTTQANGYLVSEHGVFNTDTAPIMLSHDTFTGISKTTSDEIIFIGEYVFDNTS